MLLRFEYTASFTSILSMHACGCNSRSTLVVFLSPTRDKQYVSHPFFSETNFSYVFLQNFCSLVCLGNFTYFGSEFKD